MLTVFLPWSPVFFSETTSFKLSVNMICEGFFKELLFDIVPAVNGFDLGSRGGTTCLAKKNVSILFDGVLGLKV